MVKCDCFCFGIVLDKNYNSNVFVSCLGSNANAFENAAFAYRCSVDPCSTFKSKTFDFSNVEIFTFYLTRLLKYSWSNMVSACFAHKNN